jgi:hypothetical protein
MFRRVIVAVLVFTMAVPVGAIAGPDEDAARVARGLEAIEEAAADARHDVAALAASLGEGIGPSFEHVRDRVGFDGYAGVLRGARGTLVHGAGNASDRALLLAALLEHKGVRTRFVTGLLDASATQALFARLFERPPGAAARATSDFARRVLARGERDAAVVQGALGADFAARAPSSRDEVLRGLAFHVWLEAEDNGRWVALDPSLLDAAPGRAPKAASPQTHERLPDALHQEVSVRVLEEWWDGAALQHEKRLEYVATAESLLDAHVYLLHVPPKPAGLAGALDAGAASGGPDTVVPALWVNGQAFAGQPVTFSDTVTAPARGQAPRSGLGGAFGAGGTLGSTRAFVAEWLEVEVRVPGRPPDVVRRALVNRATAAWRERPEKSVDALSPLERVGGKPCAVGEVHNLWFSAGRHDLGAFAWAVRAWGAPSSAPEDAPPTFAEQVWAFSLHNALLQIFADHVLVPSLDRTAGSRFHADSPRVAIVTVGTDVRDGVEGSRYLIDLLRDPVAGVARTAADEAAVVRGRLRYGTTQGALEHETCADLARALGLDADRVASTSGLLGEDGVHVVREAGEAQGVDDEALAARMRASLTAGVTLVAPKGGLGKGIAAWWRVAADGTTSAMLEDAHAGGIFGNLPPDVSKPPVGRGPRPGTAPRPVVDPGRPRPPLSGPLTPRPSVRQPLWPPPSDIGPFDRLPHDPKTGGAKRTNKTAGQEYLMVLTWIAVEAAFAVGMGLLLSYMPGVHDLSVDIYERLVDALP